ncbi:NAD(P)/FAD-dependent oxidoreductase [Dictyobacter aurantiacus]|uniref:FAD-dependent oxidoreductase n=1 Tax=Dictyobacter aurantiacus TaxID=1936993 RepID=A0A401ZHH9_9CHLR|nr:FAD-dependent oxidoreductase [Dictyobacter aurantiacus]GCE06296.1 FAD-dependent oxidoreductase [Dictyobacter aurantiacus]
MPSVAILGAGMSGLGAAHSLQDAGYTVTLFEKSRGVGGRAATRRRAGFIYDHGAQYIKEGTPTSLAWITERFRTPDLIDIQKPVWIFNGQGQIQPGDEKQNTEQKLNYRGGLTTLPKKMAQGLSIQFETRITNVQQETDGWRLYDSAGYDYAGFDFLFITLPAPQATKLIQNSQMATELKQAIVQRLAPVRYNPLLSIMLGYQSRPQTRPYYALVNTDKQHPISWLAWEHEKAAERVPPGAGMLIAQMAPEYSLAHMEGEEGECVRQVARLVSQLIQEELPAPIFTDLQRWRYALPSQKADGDQLNALTLPQRLAFSGDAFVGGRVHLALEHGIMVAQRLISQR